MTAQTCAEPETLDLLLNQATLAKPDASAPRRWCALHAASFGVSTLRSQRNREAAFNSHHSCVYLLNMCFRDAFSEYTKYTKYINIQNVLIYELIFIV